MEKKDFAKRNENIKNIKKKSSKNQDNQLFICYFKQRFLELFKLGYSRR